MIWINNSRNLKQKKNIISAHYNNSDGFSQRTKTISFSKKKKQQQPLFKAVLSIYAAITSCKKQKKTKKTNVLIFFKAQKTPFLGPFF